MRAAAWQENRAMGDRIGTYREFWPHYLAAHRKPRTRLAHFIGTGLGLALLLASIATRNPWLILAALVVGYAFAWFGHFAFEGNRPATFGHPLWSFFSDFRMLGLWLAGRLDEELRRNGIGRRPASPSPSPARGRGPG
jgi:hypothetical protein